MATSPDAAIADLQGTARTTRCHNAFFRQKQLKSLHDAIRNNTNTISDAIKQDTGATDSEALTEVAVILNIVKEQYKFIDPNKELEEEYRIAKGKDAADRTEPWGVVYIEPDLGHSPLFSVVSPLSAAIGAGNSVALKLENNLRALPSLLRNLLPQALELDTFQIVSSAPSLAVLSDCASVLQETHIRQPTYSQLTSSKGRSIAVVDRTADLARAAEALVTARFAFGGTSPYAPDLVLVNEFAKRDFLEHVLKHSIRFLASTSSTVPNGKSGSIKQSKDSRLSPILASLEGDKHWNVSIVTKGDSGAIVELTSTSSTHVPLPSKVKTPILCISAISSLDHGIDLVSNDSDERLLAAYHFAAPAHAKYLSQFIKADVSFVNHIPVNLLLGPAAPLFHVIDVEKRYTTEHFVRALPVSVAPLRSRVALATSSSRDAAQLLQEAKREIKEKKRPEWIAIGFFEQGILIGLGVYGVPILTCLGASIFFGVRAGLRKWAML